MNADPRATLPASHTRAVPHTHAAAPTQAAPPRRRFVDYLGLYARGFAMGASDIVPGVSGGTMALILGIYEELLDSIRAVLNREALGHALRLRLKKALDLIPWPFLLSVALGIFSAVLTMSYILEWILERYPSLLWGFFFGLVVASIFTVSQRIEKRGIGPIVGLIVGAVGTFTLVGAVPVQTPNTWWFLFLSGALAISAMVLPGISGAFILVLLGKYQTLLSAVTNLDLAPLFLVVAGAGVGIVSFAQVLGWLFKRFHDVTVAVLVGMLVGSLRKLWPWKETIQTIIDRHGKEVPIAERNILPSALTWEIGATILLAVLGFVLIWQLTAWADRRKKPE
jgi:putative membrane protein